MALKVAMVAGELMAGYEPNITCVAATELTTQAFAHIHLAALFVQVRNIGKRSNKT